MAHSATYTVGDANGWTFNNNPELEIWANVWAYL